MEMEMGKFSHGKALLLSIIVAYFVLWISGKIVEKIAKIDAELNRQCWQFSAVLENLVYA
jgi:hypothetical protein